MRQCNTNTAFELFDYRFSQVHIPHGAKCSVQSFTDVLIGGIGELVQDPYHSLVAGKPLAKNVANCHVTSETSRTFDLNAIIENSNVHVVINAVIPVDYGVANHLMNRLFRIFDFLESLRSKNFDTFDNAHRGLDGSIDESVGRPFYRPRVGYQLISVTLITYRPIAVDFDCALSNCRLGQVIEEHDPRNSSTTISCKLLFSQILSRRRGRHHDFTVKAEYF